MPAPRRDLHEAFVSFFVMSTATAALALSWSQVELSRRHNRLSTTPYINIYPRTYEAKDEPAAEDAEGIYLENKGLGPAQVKWITFFIDNVEVQPSGETSALEVIADQLQNSHIISKRETEELEPDDYIKDNDEIELLVVKAKDVLKRPDWLNFVSKKIGIAVRYCSVYGECRTACYPRGFHEKCN
jgi:hypothetical protein